LDKEKRHKIRRLTELKKYKYLITLLLAFVLTLSLVACGQTSESGKSDADKKSVKTEEKLKGEKKDSKQGEEQSEATQVDPATADSQAATSGETNATAATNQAAPQSNQTVAKNTQATPTPQPSAPVPQTAQAAPSNPAPVAKTVTVSIMGPKGATMLSPKKIEIKEGDTVFSALKATGKNVASSGSGSATYVEGIDNVYEGDYGGTSGWTYKLNGTLTPKSAGSVTVKDGDQIVWEYVGG
jgi:hypothetical protein